MRREEKMESRSEIWEKERRKECRLRLGCSAAAATHGNTRSMRDEEEDRNGGKEKKT